MEQLFIFVCRNTYTYRKYSDENDGRDYWQPIKKLLEPYDNIGIYWKENHELYK